MSAEHFVDSNVLVYAHDRSAGTKHRTARELVARLWRERSGVLSTQVLQELYVNIRHKVARPLSATEARKLLEDYVRWETVLIDGTAILEALDIESRYQVAFRDAVIIWAANASGAEVLYSEDFNAGQTYGSVRVVDPFVA